MLRKVSAVILTILDKILQSNVNVTGEKNLPDAPIIFVANHYTRFETFFVPYILSKSLKRNDVTSLAAEELFQGLLGRYFSKVGVVSSGDPMRNKKIRTSLLIHKNDWIIYPEGIMVKDKAIIRKKNQYLLKNQSEGGRVKTGAFVLGLQTEIVRQQISEAIKQGKYEELESKFDMIQDIQDVSAISPKPIYIVPLSISYSGTNYGENNLYHYLMSKWNKLVGKLTSRVQEELLVESNLLLSSNINLHLGQIVNLQDVIKKQLGQVTQKSYLKIRKYNSFIAKYRFTLLMQVMDEVYNNCQINIEHIIVMSLFFCKHKMISYQYLKEIVFANTVFLIENDTQLEVRKHDSLKHSMYKILIRNYHHIFDRFINLLLIQSVISKTTKNNQTYLILHKYLFLKEYKFHNVRIKNMFYVLYNECTIRTKLHKMIKCNTKIIEKKLSNNKIKNSFKADLMYRKDVELFEEDYNSYYKSDSSLLKEYGYPRFLKAKDKKYGVVLCHGYKSCPASLKQLARYLVDNGINVYLVRLRGHATNPNELNNLKYTDWCDSFESAFATLKIYGCEKYYFVGFSTGGLISIILATKYQKYLSGMICINAALKLTDMKARLVSAVCLWNDMLQKVKLDNILPSKEYVTDVPECSEFSYNIIYLKGVLELQKLMKLSMDKLTEVKLPTFIIQAKQDPVVRPESADYIFDNIASEVKKIYKPHLDYHNILTGKVNNKLYQKIKSFIFNPIETQGIIHEDEVNSSNYQEEISSLVSQAN